MASNSVVILSSDLALARRTRRKIFRRIVPFVFLLYIIAYLDRANVAFAKIPMAAELGFSEAVYGFGAGIFFLGYLLLEIPGGLIAQRWSARVWMARIMVTWGLCTVGVGFVHTPNQFYVTRTLLGIAEGGFFPCILVYLTHWFTAGDRAKSMAGFFMASPAALVIGAPLSALILRLDYLGIPGWRWMFILEGAPAILVGIVALGYMTDRPEQAKWLEPDERDWIRTELEKERDLRRPTEVSVWKGLRNRNVLLLGLASCFGNIGIFAFILWLPSMILKASKLSLVWSTVYSALPFILAMISIRFFGWSSDRTGRRRLHTILPFVLAAVFFVLSAVPDQPFPLVLLWFCLTGAAAYSWGVSFWVLPTLILGETAAAAAFGLINIVGNLGSFLGPTIAGYILSQGYSFTVVVGFLSCSFLIGALLVSFVHVDRDLESRQVLPVKT